jgi:hypothetical protein
MVMGRCCVFVGLDSENESSKAVDVDAVVQHNLISVLRTNKTLCPAGLGCFDGRRG